jgi:hypothetical protein
LTSKVQLDLEHLQIFRGPDGPASKVRSTRHAIIQMAKRMNIPVFANVFEGYPPHEENNAKDAA